ncbi:MAG TPA: alpha/beta hydrolase, partial [Novosphingobium sp.]|nr:alpha/beta hydrolase [Novosphingobium sp.]
MNARILGGAFALAALFASATQAQETNQRFQADGTLNLPASKLPPSSLVSQGYRDAYLKSLRDEASWPFPAPAFDAPKPAWDKFDADYDRLVASPALADIEKLYPAKVEEQMIDGVRVGIVTPDNGIAPENRDRVLIHAHGGGFFAGRGLVGGLVEALPMAHFARMKVVTIDYRMAPYFRFPAASEDVEKVYRRLLRTYRPKAIGMFGCSAGGALTAQTVTWLASKKLPGLGAAGIFCSAPVPFGKGGDSRVWGGGTGPMPATPQGYMAGADPSDPRAFPAASDEALAKFPPVLLYSGTRAADLSPVVVAHARFLKLGVDSEMYIQENGQHGAFVVGQRGTPEAVDTLAYMARWF